METIDLVTVSRVFAASRALEAEQYYLGMQASHQRQPQTRLPFSARMRVAFTGRLDTVEVATLVGATRRPDAA